MKVYQTNITICNNYKQYWSYKERFIQFTVFKQKKEKEYTSEYTRNCKSYSYYYQNETNLDLTKKEVKELNTVLENFVDINLNVKVKDMLDFILNLKKNSFNETKRVPKNVKTVKIFNKRCNIYIDLMNHLYHLENN